MSINWLQGLHHHADQPDEPMAMPVFAGQKLVVVGGSSGMGRQTAEDVVAAGGSAVIIGEDPAKVDDTVQTLAKDGKAWGITADLADRDQVERVRQQGAGDHADATLLVNAAGFFIPKPFLEHDGAFYDAYLELDRAIFFLTQTVARAMVEACGGSIVNVGSMWGHQAIAATPASAYSVAKAGLHALTRNLAMELAPHHIRVNAVAPAVVATPIYERFVPADKLEETLHSFDSFHLIGRVGTASDLANTITFLLSPATSGSPAPSGTSTAASWPDATEPTPGHPRPPARPPGVRGTPHLRPGPVLQAITIPEDRCQMCSRSGIRISVMPPAGAIRIPARDVRGAARHHAAQP